MYQNLTGADVKVFIDTNILLDIYHLFGSDLEELRKLKKMVEKGKVLVSKQIIDEFWKKSARSSTHQKSVYRSKTTVLN